jgi:hypothetical protein
MVCQQFQTIYILFICLGLPCSVQAQFEITGRIIDGTTKPLPYATILPNLAIADLDGNFQS